MSKKKKAPGKVVDYTGKHKLEAAGILSRKEIKQLDPMLVDSILSPLYDTVKRGKKKFMGGAVMKNRGGTFKGTY